MALQLIGQEERALWTDAASRIIRPVENDPFSDLSADVEQAVKKAAAYADALVLAFRVRDGSRL